MPKEVTRDQPCSLLIIHSCLNLVLSHCFYHHSIIYNMNIKTVSCNNFLCISFILFLTLSSLKIFTLKFRLVICTLKLLTFHCRGKVSQEAFHRLKDVNYFINKYTIDNIPLDLTILIDHLLSNAGTTNYKTS